MLSIPWLKNSDSIVDLNWNVIFSEEREKIIKSVQDLPASKKKDDILHAFNDSPIVLVRGETWSWKSTQLPKIIYRELVENIIWEPRIIWNQPRVSAATWLAKRVSEEMFCETWDSDWSLWEKIWYRTWRWVRASSRTNIAYHTSWYELMRLASSWKYPDAVILDEFHTDDIYNTTLAYLVRKELEENNKKFKLIITSATINSLKTLDYFASISRDIPIIDIEWRTFPVEKIFASSSEFQFYLRDRYNSWDNILIFEEWKREIEKTINEIHNTIWEDVLVYPFHWDLSIEEQREIIDYKPENGEQIIIVATNSAEESLTVSYIDTVIDRGNHKVASVNELWVDRLDSEPVSKANFKQRIWRAWRVKDGIGIRVNSVDFDSLPDFPEAPIKKTTLEKEILILLKNGINLADELIKHYSEGRNMFIDNPSDSLVNLSYERLYRLWAIDKNWITELWNQILSFPLDVFNSRILIESIERWVSKDILEIVSILEHNGFLLWKWEWKEIYKSKNKSKRSDLFFQLSLFRDLTSTYLSGKKLDFFAYTCDFWDDWIEEYKKGEKMLYEYIDADTLEIFWVNKRSMQKIVDTMKELKTRFISQEKELSSIWTMDDKIISILSWNLHNIFEYDEKKKSFTNSFLDWKNIEFKLWNISTIDPSGSNKWTYYIWKPFIIWWNWENWDFNILQSVTLAKERHISVFSDRLTAVLPRFNFKWQTEFSIARKKYKDELKNIPNLPYIDEKTIKQDIVLNNFIDFLEENSDNYSDIIIFLKNLKQEKRRILREKFKKLLILKEQYTELKKKKTWIESFLVDIKEILSWEEVSLSHLSLGVSRDSQLFMSDPIIKEYDFLEQANKQKKIYLDIKRIFDFIELSDKEKKTFFRSFKKIQSSNSKKHNTWKKHIWLFISKLRDIQEDNNYEIRALSNAPKGKRKKIRYLEKENKRINNVIASIEEFTENASKIRDSINSIDFNEILYSKRDSNRIVFTRKYLYSIIGDIIFNWDFISTDLKTKTKLTLRLEKYLWEVLNQNAIDDLTNAIHVILTKWINEKTKKKAEEIIIEKFKTIKEHYDTSIKKSEEVILSDIDSLNKWDIDKLYTNIKWILLDFFEDEDYIKKHSFKVFKFVQRIFGLSTKSFDKNLSEFISSFDFNKSIEYDEYFNLLGEYISKKNYIETHHLRDVKKQIKTWKIDTLELEQEILNLKSAIKEVNRLKRILHIK